MGKGDQTRQRILALALEEACRGGFAGLHLQPLAARAGLTKSGLYAHFRARDALLLATLDHAGQRFRDVVLRPAKGEEAGGAQLAGIHDRWLAWPGNAGFPGTCPYCQSIGTAPALGPAAAAQLARQFREFRAVIEALAAAALRRSAGPTGLSAAEFTHEWFGLRFAAHWASEVLQVPDARARSQRALDALLARLGAPGAPAQRP